MRTRDPPLASMSSGVVVPGSRRVGDVYVNVGATARDDPRGHSPASTSFARELLMRTRASPGTLAGVRQTIVFSVRTCAASGPIVPITHASSSERSNARIVSPTPEDDASSPSPCAEDAERTSDVPPSLDPRAGSMALAASAALTLALGPGADHVSPSSFVMASAYSPLGKLAGSHAITVLLMK